MKKSAWKFTFFILTALCFANISCNQNDQDNVTNLSETEKIKLIFEESVENKNTDLTLMAEKITSDVLEDYSCVIQPMEPGYFPGFNLEISDFTEAVGFSPVISSIPLVGYIFKSDNSADLFNYLFNTYNARWNICTEAQIVGSYIKDNYVIFVMLPGNEEF